MNPAQAMGLGQAARETQVMQMAARQAEAAKYLRDRLDQLEIRLAAVLQSAGPSTPKENNKPLPALVPHAAALSNVSDMIQGASTRIEDLVNRLEL